MGWRGLALISNLCDGHIVAAVGLSVEGVNPRRQHGGSSIEQQQQQSSMDVVG